MAPDFERLARKPWAVGFLGILRHHFLKLGLGAFMLLMGRTGAAIDGCKFRPCVGPAHVDDADRLQPGPWRFDPEQMRRLAGLDAAPELLLGRDQDMLVQ